jgi:Rrf2 family protein
MLSAKAQYAMHALTYLGEQHGKGLIPIHEIAKARQIPNKFLEAILLELRRAGMLGSKAGKNGGYYLIKSPEEIPLTAILRLMDGPIALLPCVSKKFYEPCRLCPYPEASCNIRHIFLEIRDATLKVIEGKTLSDLLRKEIAFPTDFSI